MLSLKPVQNYEVIKVTLKRIRKAFDQDHNIAMDKINRTLSHTKVKVKTLHTIQLIFKRFCKNLEQQNKL